MLFLLAILFLFPACDQSPQVGAPAVEDQPVVIRYRDNGRGTIDSFSAEVEVWQGIDRIPSSMKLSTSYRLAQKIVDGHVCIRMDFGADPENGIAARTVITNAQEMIVFCPTTGAVELRAPLGALDAEMGALPPEAARSVSLMGRIGDVEALVTEFRRLAYDVMPAASGGYEVRLPVGEAPASGPVPLSCKLFLDAENGVIAGTEYVMQTEEGVIVTSTQTPIYEERDGILVQVGEAVKVNNDLPPGEPVPSIYPNEEAMADAPIVTQAELDALAASGAQVSPFIAETGDPSDPDYTIEQVTLYDDIDINSVPDELFRIDL